MTGTDRYGIGDVSGIPLVVRPGTSPPASFLPSAHPNQILDLLAEVRDSVGDAEALSQLTEEIWRAVLGAIGVARREGRRLGLQERDTLIWAMDRILYPHQISQTAGLSREYVLKIIKQIENQPEITEAHRTKQKRMRKREEAAREKRRQI